MRDEIVSKLAAVRRRQRWVLAIRTAACGLLAGGAGAVALGLWSRVSAEPVPMSAAVLLLCAGPVLGAAVGLLWPQSWRSAAATVDRRCRLKDRALTAMEFAGKHDGSPFHELQIRDAAAHLTGVEASRVVPARAPRILPYAVCTLILAVGLWLWPQPPRMLSAGQPAANPGIVAVFQEIGSRLDDLDQLAEGEEDEELKALVEKLRELSEEMQEPGVEVRDALAALSEMQAAIAAQQAEYNDALVDAQLQSLGGAMSAAEALQGAGQALEQGDFEKAAQELEQLEDAELSRREARAVSEQVRKAAEAMKEAGLGRLSDAAAEMADGIGSGQSGKTSKAARELSRLVRRHNVRRNVNRCLARELDRLNECKSACLACQGDCPLCGGACQAGQCQGGANSMAEGFNPQKSTSPTNTFGRGTSGNLFGDQTEIASNRNLVELTGELGDGPSDVEVTNSPEGRETARRGYRENYERYQKLSEAVLDSEPIPLGHRQTIRRYFELIRPSAE